MSISEIAPNAFLSPLKEHVIYYLSNNAHVVFVDVISNNMAPAKHLQKKQNLNNELIN